MARTEPRALLRFIVDEWSLIEAIYLRTRKGPVRPRVLRELTAESANPRVTERLIEEGILVPLPNSPSYEMGEFVQSLVAQLKEQHTLGLAGEIRIYLEDLDRQTTGIFQAIEDPDHEKLVRHIDSLEHRIKIILRQLANNGQAVEDMVVRAKTRRRHTSLKSRYAEVLEAWETYVDPVREMVDPTGPFEALFERLEQELRQAIRVVVTHGGLLRERGRLELLLYRLMHLRGQLVRHLGEAAEQLLPLVREIRRNSVIARGASIALKRMHEGSLDTAGLTALVPVVRRPSGSSVADAGYLESYIADLSAYSPAPQPILMPARDRSDEPREGVFDDQAMFEALVAAAPVPDLMDWLLCNAGPDAEIDDILDLYFRAQSPDAALSVHFGPRAQYESRTHFIHAAAVGVSPVADAGTDSHARTHDR